MAIQNQNQKVTEILTALTEYTPKEMRTLRNRLNNRICSFERELEFKIAVPVIKPSHLLHGLNLLECKTLLFAAKKHLKNL